MYDRCHLLEVNTVQNEQKTRDQYLFIYFDERSLKLLLWKSWLDVRVFVPCFLQVSQTWTIPVKVKKEVSWAIQSTDRRLREPVKVKMLTRSLFLAFFFVIFAPVDAQYEKYSFKSFPQKDIMPLESAYNYAMEQYGAQNWAETIKFLELSLRLHRLLRDSEAFCCSNCSSVSRDNDTLFEDTSLRVMRHILLRAACLKKCKADFPVFKLTYPRRDLLETFEKRIPYRYIQYAYFQVRLSVEVSSLGLWECNAKLVQYLSTAYHKNILRVTGAFIQQKRLQLASLDRLARFTYREEISSGLAVECNFATTLLCALLLAKQQLSMCHVSSSVPLKTIPLFFCQSDGGVGVLSRQDLSRKKYAWSLNCLHTNNIHAVGEINWTYIIRNPLTLNPKSRISAVPPSFTQRLFCIFIYCWLTLPQNDTFYYTSN